jgi:predicted XRE-type DNA-binding protein
MEGFVLKKRNQLRLDVLMKVRQGKMKRREAEQVLGVSEPTLW